MHLKKRTENNSISKYISKHVGPGFITGAADDDPSGIFTYSQTGALFGLSQLWTAIFSYPFMVVIQEMCGRIGLVTGRGLAGVIKTHYSKYILFFTVSLLVIANAINIGADLGAMAASLQLLVNLPFLILLLAITSFTIFVEVLVPYPIYSKFLKYLTFSLLAYVCTAFIIKQDWVLVLRSTLTPHIEFTKEYILNIAAILGTTISPYLFFWQADEEVEEEIVAHKILSIGEGVPNIEEADIKKMRVDTYFGMFFSNLISFFIILTAASTLGISGFKNIDSLSEAASALRPLAGDFAFLLFTFGIFGTGLLAVPVLAGSAAYAISESLNWNAGLGKKFSQAYGFYAVIILATLMGLIVNFLSISPVTMLYYTSVLNGVMAPPLMILILFIANNKKVLGSYTNSAISNIFGSIITIVMSAISLSLLVSLFV